MAQVTLVRVFVRVTGGILLLRMALGIIFAITLIGSPEGDMLILLDLPALFVRAPLRGASPRFARLDQTVWVH